MKNLRRFLQMALPLAVMLGLAACQHSRMIDREGNAVEATSFFGRPLDLSQQAEGKNKSPRLSQHAGPAQVSAAELASGRSSHLMAWGSALILLGVLSWVAKTYVPVIPTTLGTCLVLTGAGMVVASYVLPAIPWWAWLAALGAGAVFVIPGLQSNREMMRRLAALQSPAPAVPASGKP